MGFSVVYGNDLQGLIFIAEYEYERLEVLSDLPMNEKKLSYKN